MKKRKEKETKLRVTCTFASDEVSTREEHEALMRKYEEIYKTLSEIMERVDKEIEEKRRNGMIQASAEDEKSDNKKGEINTKIIPKNDEDKKKSAEDEVLKLLSGHKLKIYKYVIENEYITTKIAMGVIGLKERRSREILVEMCEEGYLRRIGATSSLKYVRGD